MTDPEDLLSDSLQTLYDYAPITHSSAGSFFTYTYAGQDATHDEQPSPSNPSNTLTITLQTPDTQPANWTLHASSIWVSSLFLADHMHDLRLARHLARASARGAPLRVLELGAGAGLPGILLARRHDGVRVVSSDYPDAGLIKTLAENVARNGAQDRCRAVPYAWGSDPAPLFSAFAGPEPHALDGFDVVLATDTLWNSELHGTFIQTLCVTLRRSAHARVFLVAGLHTGRYTIQSFMRAVEDAGLVFEEAMEKESNGDGSRPWDVERAGETEKDRRRWVVWMVLRWPRT
ncbi:hypothetical protein WOLCODRAFT_82177 [Wolfiporia cocos MD-104 SS10]|uniref:Nicotinamide N-methyltransferase n=1 Tax=Wolfiporia cocos (strain MD-104) TaxID=742152 RepID=A0A2H3J2D0_WOLCO|nr:hypothetical protein WOLCODRAFT_82177 [Wolfiporia cocos MD-104 SS10]